MIYILCTDHICNKWHISVQLLAFVFFKYNADNRKDLETIICNFYGEEDVSEAKTLIHQYYKTVIGPRPGRQNRGTKTLKEKEVSDILDVKYNADNRKDLETIICNFYGEEDVSEAKTLIHQVCFIAYWMQ